MRRLVSSALAVLAALWPLLGAPQALAATGSVFPTPTPGQFAVGTVMMCFPNGSNQAVPCSSGTPLNIAGSFSATLNGFQPTPSYAQLAASDALNHSVAVPTGTTDVVYNLDTNVAYCNFGAASTTNTTPVQPGSAVPFYNPSAFATIQCQSPTSSLKITISGGVGLWTGVGGGGGSGIFPAVVGSSGSTAPTPVQFLVIGGVNGSNQWLPAIMTATQAIKVANSDIQSSIGTPATSANAVQGALGAIPIPVSGFLPGNSYASLSASDALNHSVATPTGADEVISNLDTNLAYCNFGAASTTSTMPVQGLQSIGIHFGSTSSTVQCQSPTSTLNIRISGGTGLFTSAGGGGGGAGGAVNLTEQASQTLAAPTAPGTPAVTGLVPTVNVANASGTGCPITNAGTGATTGCGIQGVPGGVPVPVNGLFIPTSTPSINISTATTTLLVSAIAGKSIYVTTWDVSAATGTFEWVYGTQTTSPCDTGATVIRGPYTMNGSQIGVGAGSGIVFMIPTNTQLCAVTSAATQYSGGVAVVQQ